MPNTDIVVVNESVQLAPIPPSLQQSGAMLTTGGTNTPAGTLTLLQGGLPSLLAILGPSLAITSLTWSGGVVTVTTTAPHGWTDSETIPVTIAGVTPSGYNGTVQATVTGASTFTYPHGGTLTTPASVPGTATLGAVNELLQMGTTFFAQFGNQSVYVLELGEGTVSDGVTALTTFITNNPRTIYSYLVQREWDNQTVFLDILPNYTAPEALTYFYVTTTVANRAVYANLKCVFAEVESPTISPTEFSLAAAWASSLDNVPSSTSLVPPMSYRFLYGVTAYPTPGNGAIFSELATANVGWVATGQEGGVPSAMIVKQGQMSDGNPWNFWYAGDWANLNCKVALANEVINGSNSTINPLYYNQPGINRLQRRCLQTLGQAISNGLGNGTLTATALPTAQFTTNYNNGVYLGQIVVNAEPYTNYTQENPDNYGLGIYGGLTCVFTPLRGFLQVIFNLEVTDLVAG